VNDRQTRPVQLIKEQLTFTDEDTAMANLLLTVWGRSQNLNEP
jgi:hypothetical protein